MIVRAYIFDATTGETIATFGLDVDGPGYYPERWALLRRYTLPAQGPAGHPWPHWAGALLILTTVFALLGSHL